jgi:hypothetical protein
MAEMMPLVRAAELAVEVVASMMKVLGKARPQVPKLMYLQYAAQ